MKPKDIIRKQQMQILRRPTMPHIKSVCIGAPAQLSGKVNALDNLMTDTQTLYFDDALYEKVVH